MQQKIYPCSPEKSLQRFLAWEAQMRRWLPSEVYVEFRMEETRLRLLEECRQRQADWEAHMSSRRVRWR